MDLQLSYCGGIVRTQDADRFLLSMFAPATAREDLWALFAFNYEIAKTREVVSETQLGLIRLQWWRERIAEIYDGKDVAEHEVLQALSRAITRHSLAREDFEMLIHAREFDLEDVLPANIEGLMNYADFTATPLLKMAAQIIGVNIQIEPIRVLAQNYALIGILRAVPFLGSHRRCYLPEDLMKQYGQSVNKFYEGKVVDNFAEIISRIAAHIETGVVCENAFLKRVNRLSMLYLRQLKKCDFNVFDGRMAHPLPFRALRLFFNM